MQITDELFSKVIVSKGTADVIQQEINKFLREDIEVTHILGGVMNTNGVTSVIIFYKLGENREKLDDSLGVQNEN